MSMKRREWDEIFFPNLLIIKDGSSMHGLVALLLPNNTSHITLLHEQNRQ